VNPEIDVKFLARENLISLMATFGNGHTVRFRLDRSRTLALASDLMRAWNEAGNAPKEPEAPRRRRPGYSLNLPRVEEGKS
jgi:hypothetical protein